MFQTIYFCTLSILLILLISVSSENIDTELLCYPEAHKNTRKSCECANENVSPWGLHGLTIDCSYKELQNKDFSENLPLYVNTLDLSWNALESIPVFSSDSLKTLNLVHNNISKVLSKNFVNVSNLRDLYLTWNSIQVIEANAFADLAHLRVLDLAHNNIRILDLQIFGPMLVLETLSLSWNRQLNQTEGIQELDFYRTFGINPKLEKLKLEACSLNNIVLPVKAQLAELNLRRNLFTKIPEKLPFMLQKLVMSENLLETLQQADTQNLSHVHELYLEDMPRLQSLQAESFVPMQSLEKVSFQNSRRLSSIDAYAFGRNNTKRSPLHTMIFRGTGLRTFNSTLFQVFDQLTELDLNGLSLFCYCDLVWLKELKLETNGRCFKPSRLRGMRLSNAHASDFSCNNWPAWVNGLITLGLIVLLSLGIYFIVMGLRPKKRGVVIRRKVGAGSPYARVTIEPNKQEHF